MPAPKPYQYPIKQIKSILNKVTVPPNGKLIIFILDVIKAMATHIADTASCLADTFYALFPTINDEAINKAKTIKAIITT